MITLTKLDGSKFVINSDLIETVEEKPDTTIRMTTKTFYIVKETMSEVVDHVVKFKSRINKA